MRSPFTLKPELLAELRLQINPGQPLVVAFADSLELRECAALNRIRAELRGLGAALFLVARRQIFSFQPDDELDLYGTSRAVDARALSALRAACGFSENTNVGELSLSVLGADGSVVAQHTLATADQLAALADGLSAAGREVIVVNQSLLLSRREVVLASLVGAFALLALDGCHAKAPPPVPAAAPSVSKTRKISLNINGQAHELEAEPRVSLLDALRERLALTGTKKGCDHGQCGACTVLIAGRRVNACLTLAVMVGDAPITTIEGLAQGDTLHPMQAAFVEQDALQCGYCTPGQIMSALGLVRENRAHSDDEVREHMSGNICR
ncbi:MAG TPA: (2Fe-2S)-binding protein, partial [Polyangiaceae bacterium]|nr:(2Fe-2S)-binding protein [Polyangiaceae bacterium]